LCNECILVTWVEFICIYRLSIRHNIKHSCYILRFSARCCEIEDNSLVAIIVCDVHLIDCDIRVIEARKDSRRCQHLGAEDVERREDQDNHAKPRISRARSRKHDRDVEVEHEKRKEVDSDLSTWPWQENRGLTGRQALGNSVIHTVQRKRTSTLTKDVCM
jgi:hypothetical protein